jgi:hypothetical protein
MSGFLSLAVSVSATAQDRPSGLPVIRYHLTGRPWQPLAIPRDGYLDAIEGICRFTIRHQDGTGAVIDPFLHREYQFSTPYFAFAVGVLVRAGRAADLLPYGARAMDHATSCFAGGLKQIPDEHGEFFVPALTGALELYRGHVAEQTWETWRARLRPPIGQVIQGDMNNWRTYAMKGEWMRFKAGLVDRSAATSFVAESWWFLQRNRMFADKWNLYQDRSSDPDSHAVEAVGRGNLIALMAESYDGPFADEIRDAIDRATRVSLLLQDPSGQCPMNGRTDDHVFNDVLYQLAFEVMAEDAYARGDSRLAGQYRHAAMLSFQSINRWRRNDGEWAGSFYVTKNKFDPADRVGYQRTSSYGTYDGAVMMHLGEAWLGRKTVVPEQPAPVEIGGYVVAMDSNFSSLFANAGGMQMAANLRGDTNALYETFWTPLGVVRFGRPNWDTRLGPSDGVRDYSSKRGITFAPTWREKGQWIRLADVPERYRGHLDTEFVHPLLVRCRIEYSPIPPGDGPTFQQEFVITPDGVLASLRPSGEQKVEEYGVTLPLLENDGTPLETAVSRHIASTRYPNTADEQDFIMLDASPVIDNSELSLRGPYGWLRPVRFAAAAGRVNEIFVYPRGAGDPTAEAIRASFKRTRRGFSSLLGRVEGKLYVGRTAAGGEGDRLDLKGDGKDDVVFSTTCGFLLQLHNRKVTALETDRAVDALVQGRRVRLSAYRPVSLINGSE